MNRGETHQAVVLLRVGFSRILTLLPAPKSKIADVRESQTEMLDKKKIIHLDFIHYSPVAQSAEQVAVNHWVGGSSPSGGAKKPVLGQAFLL